MNWRTKSAIQNVVALLPDEVSYEAYYGLQRAFGKVAGKNPLTELRKAGEIMRLVRQHRPGDGPLAALEIGTGRALNVPIGISLAGATRIITVDAHRYLKAEMVMAALASMRNHRDDVADLFAGLSDGTAIGERLNALVAA